jgi:hypothetical protein
LTDIDDTLTFRGKLPAIAYYAMERLQEAGIKIIPITGRPAGWCDHIARMWPVDGLVGENGAFYFRYDPNNREMKRRYWRKEDERADDMIKLAALQQKILKEVPGCRISADQAYREADLAIDFCEDVEPLPPSEVKKIVSLFESAGAIAKISSIHVNGWFGNYDKLSMTGMLFKEVFQVDIATTKDQILFSGDSPNDTPMFSFFPHSVGVANILNFSDNLTSKPTWITKREGGYGFAEMTDVLLSG